MKTEIQPGPKQTEDSVVWFALLARARLTGDSGLLARARARLVALGLDVRLIDKGSEVIEAGSLDQNTKGGAEHVRTQH